MIKKLYLIILIILLANPAHADFRDLPNITVLAASSLTEPMTQIIRMYSRQHDITVSGVYDSSSEQALKIQEGESADVFVSSHPFWMNELKKMGLIDVYSVANIVKNKLVLVTSAQSNLNEYSIPGDNFQAKLEYLNNRVIMSMGDPNSTSLGLYTKQSLQKIDENNHTNLWENFNSHTIKTSNSKYNLYLISHGETAGITYYSDAYNNNEVHILSVVDEELHDPIIYQAAVVAGENMTIAREFVDFLRSDTAKQIFKKYGFIVD
jgi:molybdate transport system substrate-binding protein